MFVSFLSPHRLFGSDAVHLGMFYKQATTFRPGDIAFIGSSGYFLPPAVRRTPLRWEWGPDFRRTYEYTPPDDISGVVRATLPADLFDRRMADVQSPVRLYRQMLTRRLPELEAAVGAALDELSAVAPIEAVLTFLNSPSVEHVARRRGLPVIHNEIGPLRPPQYGMTAYWDRRGVNGRTEAAQRFRAFRRELRRRACTLLSREEIVRTLARGTLPPMAGDPSVRLGVAMQIEHDSNVLAFSNGFSGIDLIDMARDRFAHEDVRVRSHPKGPTCYASWLAPPDDSASAAEFILKCERVLTINSSVALEAALLGRDCVVVGDSPFRLVSRRSLDDEAPLDEEARTLALNFLVFGYIVPYPAIFDAEYCRWRLTDPSEIEILEHHQRWWRARLDPQVGAETADLTLRTAARLLNAVGPGAAPARLFLFGAGASTARIAGEIRPDRFRVAGVFDNDPRKWGTELAGARVQPPAYDPAAMVLVSSITHAVEMRDQARAIGYDAGRVLTLCAAA